jgi:hypothetical protein
MWWYKTSLCKLNHFECGHDVAIEKELETAIFKVGGIRDSNFGDLDKIKWGRSSRTDKGVSNLLVIPLAICITWINSLLFYFSHSWFLSGFMMWMC